MRIHSAEQIKKAAVSALLLAALLFSLSVFPACSAGTFSGTESVQSLPDGPGQTASEGGPFELTPTPPVVDIHTKDQANYLNGPYYDIARYADGWNECSKPEPLILRWVFHADALPEGVSAPDSFTVLLDRSDRFDSPLVRTVAASAAAYEAPFDNLFLDTAYCWKVSADCGGTVYESDVLHFRTAATAPRNLNVGGVSNVRDIGGWKIDDRHRVRQGLVFRGAAFEDLNYGTHITEEGIRQAREELGVKTEIELRWISVGEIAHRSDSLLGGDTRYCEFEFNYSDDVLFDANTASIAKCFRKLADEKNYPVYYHCRIGTDRTGVLTFLLLGFLGVGREQLLTDYLFSNFGHVGGRRSVATIEESYLNYIESCEGETLQEKITWCLKNRCGLTDYVLDRVRALMIEEI